MAAEIALRPGEVVLCRSADVTGNHARGFDPAKQGKDSVFALRHAGELRVYRNSCPHLDVRLEYRKDRFLSPDAELIVCYAHGARFLPSTGECVYGPCLGEFLQPLPWREEAGWLVLEQMP